MLAARKGWGIRGGVCGAFAGTDTRMGGNVHRMRVSGTSRDGAYQGLREMGNDVDGHEAGGIQHVLRVAVPLVLASSSTAIKIFVDRTMLSHYSDAAFSASFSAGLTNFTFGCFFLGIIMYTGTFVAQYTGARKPDRVGDAVWQGIYLAIPAGGVLALVGFLAEPLFRFVDHGEEVFVHQVPYFQILMGGWVFQLVWQAVICFWSGRGRTWTIAAIEGVTVLANIILNYALIFGHFGMPELGIVGAALGTVLSFALGMTLALLLLTRTANRLAYQTWPRRPLDLVIVKRLLRFGFPNGLQFALDLLSFNVFVMLTHRMGEVAQQASTIAFSINAVAFIPMIGIGIAAGILVGQGIGAGDTALARRAVRNALWVVLVYFLFTTTLVAAAGMLYVDRIFPLPGSGDAEAVYAMARWFLLFILAFMLFDGLFILYSHAIKGAGDTAYAMWMAVGLAWGMFAIPCLVVYLLGGSIWIMWGILVVYVVVASIIFCRRYRQGQWQRMRVIEHT